MENTNTQAQVQSDDVEPSHSQSDQEVNQEVENDSNAALLAGGQDNNNNAIGQPIISQSDPNFIGGQQPGLQYKIQQIQLLQQKQNQARQFQNQNTFGLDGVGMDEFQDGNGDEQQNMEGYNDGIPQNSAILNALNAGNNSRQQQQNAIQRQSIAPGYSPETNKRQMNQQKANQMSNSKSAIIGGSNQKRNNEDNDNNLIDLNDINLRLSENVEFQKQVKQKSPMMLNSEKINVEQESKCCEQHEQDYILFCLKCQEKICTKCLDTNHLLHPVVPLNSVNKLDFKNSLQKEIEKSLEDIKMKESLIHKKIRGDLTKHKIALRNHIIFVRDSLRNDFDDFFNSLLNSIRSDWNLFEMQEQLSKESTKFAKEIQNSLSRITQQDEFEQIYYHNDLKKFYENLSGAQTKVQDYKQDWTEYEKGVDNLVDSLKSHSEFDIIDGNTMKNFLAENLVMNYSNIEIHKILFQSMITGQKQHAAANQFNGDRRNEGSSLVGVGSSLQNAPGVVNNIVRGQPGADQADAVRNNNLNQEVQQNQNISFNRNSQLAMANNFAQTGIRMVSRPAANTQQVEAARTNKIHFFKFDQKIVTFYNVDHERKQREVLNIDFNIPIRFCSIQTNDGRIFITGGAKNTSQSSNHAYEFRNGTLIQLPNMINPREGHCLAAVGNSYIYAIGSRLYNTSKTCEVYSIENNCWGEKPELNRNRYLSTAVTIQQRFIYVFGGYEPSVTDIERLDTVNNEQPAFWELIKVWSSSLEADIKYWFGACPISQSDILIFGGKKDGASSISSYIFDTQQNQITKTGSLPNKDTFYQRTFLCKNNKVYAYGYENDFAYIYNMQTKTWTKK